MKRIFIDGLSGMAQGLFATLIIGTIIQQIGLFVGGDYGNLIYMIGKVAAGLTGAGIGVGVARKLEAQQLVTVSAAVAGMIGAFASKLLAGQLIVDGNLVLAGPGEPLGAFIAAYLAIGMYRYGICSGTGCRAADFKIYGMARVTDQLGNRTAAVSDGHCSIGSDGNLSDTADQFRSDRGDSESVGTGSGSCDSWLLL